MIEKNINYKRFFADRFKIVDKNSQVVPFVLNPIQEKYLLEDYTGNDLILKARQQGFSSLILALFTADFLLKDNQRNVITADNTDNAQELLDRVKFFIKSYEEIVEARVPLKYNSKYELFNEATNSRYTIGTAENTEFGRSKTVTNLHLCVGEKTKVLLTDGSTKTIKEVKIGDELVAEDGKPTKVTNKIFTGEKEVIKIRNWLGNEEIFVSRDHKVRVMGKSKIWHTYRKVGGPVWKRAEELTNNDYILWAYPKTGAFVKFLTVPKIKNCVHLPVNYVQRIANQRTDNYVVRSGYKLGYFLGYYLAEGHIDKKISKVELASHVKEEFYKNFIDLFPYEPRIRITKDKNGERKTITYYSTEIASFVNNLVGRVENKHVPSEFLYQYPKSFLRGLYEGWRDGDGSKAKLKWKNISITTIHEKIARQMKQIYALLTHRLLALDYSQDRFRYGKQTKPVYILREYGFDKEKGHSRGASKQKYVVTRKVSPKNGYLFVKIKDITQAGIMKTYEIEVEHPSHSFMTVCGVVSNSECFFYPHFEKLLAGALQAVVPTGRVIFETTANGYNYGKTFWDECVLGERPFKPLFYPASAFYDKDFLKTKREQLKEIFRQEYPENPTEAFLASGEQYFDPASLSWYLENAKETIPYEL